MCCLVMWSEKMWAYIAATTQTQGACRTTRKGGEEGKSPCSGPGWSADNWRAPEYSDFFSGEGWGGLDVDYRKGACKVVLVKCHAWMSQLMAIDEFYFHQCFAIFLSITKIFMCIPNMHIAFPSTFTQIWWNRHQCSRWSVSKEWCTRIVKVCHYFPAPWCTVQFT